MGDVQDVIQTAIGGMNITTTVEGLERYPLNMRYARELRDDLPALERLLVPAPTGAQIPLGQLAKMAINPGPPMIRSENAQRTAWIYVDIAGRDLGGYHRRSARHRRPPRSLCRRATPSSSPASSSSGRRPFPAPRRPLGGHPGDLRASSSCCSTSSSRSWFRVAVIMLAVPFSLIGAFWFLYLLDYNLSLAVVIGIIAPGRPRRRDRHGHAPLPRQFAPRFRDREVRGSLLHADLWAAVRRHVHAHPGQDSHSWFHLIGLLPLLWSHGTGKGTPSGISESLIGGILIGFLMELIVYPVSSSISRNAGACRAPLTHPRSARAGFSRRPQHHGSLE